MRTFRNISFAIFLLTFVVAHRAHLKAFDDFCGTISGDLYWGGEADCACTTDYDGLHTIECYGLFGGCGDFCTFLAEDMDCLDATVFTCSYTQQDGCVAECDFTRVYN